MIFWGWAVGKQLEYLILLFQKSIFSRFCNIGEILKLFMSEKKLPYDMGLYMHKYLSCMLASYILSKNNNNAIANYCVHGLLTK